MFHADAEFTDTPFDFRLPLPFFHATPSHASARCRAARATIDADYVLCLLLRSDIVAAAAQRVCLDDGVEHYFMMLRVRCG